MRLEPGFQDWVDALDIGEFYIGIDVLIFVSVLMIVVAVLSAGSSLVEHPLALFVVSILDQVDDNQIYIQSNFILCRTLVCKARASCSV